MTVAKAPPARNIRFPSLLLALVGGGLAYWAIFAKGGLLKNSPDRSAILTAYTSSGSGVTPVVTSGSATVEQFKSGIAHFESGGNYLLINGMGTASSYAALLNAPPGHAIGKYQFLPGEWKKLSMRYYGTILIPTPSNQELLATRRFNELYGELHDWRLVAVAWRSGSSIAHQPISTWTLGLVRYVNNIGCWLSRTYGKGWPLISLVGHTGRDGVTYSDTSHPYGSLTDCSPSSGQLG